MTPPPTANGPSRQGGSRFLYEPFGCQIPNCGPGRTIEVYQSAMTERWAALEYRLNHIEARIALLEKRVWVTIAGVTSVVLAQAAQSIMAAAQ